MAVADHMGIIANAAATTCTAMYKVGGVGTVSSTRQEDSQESMMRLMGVLRKGSKGTVGLSMETSAVTVMQYFAMHY